VEAYLVKFDGPPANDRLVNVSDFPKKDTHRPSIRDDVVHHDYQHMDLWFELDEPEADKRPYAEVERSGSVCSGYA
jgi:hypothetical protein